MAIDTRPRSHGRNLEWETRQVDQEDLEVYLHESLAELLETISEVRYERVASECERGQLWLA